MQNTSHVNDLCNRRCKNTFRDYARVAGEGGKASVTYELRMLLLVEMRVDCMDGFDVYMVGGIWNDKMR